ncbi:MAG: futalosine hydrolase [Phycisphaerales bacterium]|nr:futalosine hydrolase [Planctomycetota bacterium]
MSDLQQQFVQKKTGRSARYLLVVAAEIEARAVLAGLGVHARDPVRPWEKIRVTDKFDLVLSGVGKANGAGACAAALADSRCGAVVNLGICGGLPSPQPSAIGDAIFALHSQFADEGIERSSAWLPISQAGFPAGIQGDLVPADEELASLLVPRTDRAGIIATVSSCSGTDLRAREILRRLGPDGLAEAMEGAAVGLAAARLGARFAEVRVVSNTTGERERQVWDIPKALARLEGLAREMSRVL